MHKRPGVLVNFDLNISVVACGAPIVQPEIDVAVLSDELRRLDLDVGERLPAALLKAQKLFPTVIHSDPPGLLAGHDLYATDAVTDVVVNAHPVVVPQVSLACVIRMHINNGSTTLEAEHRAMIPPGGMDGPSSVRSIPVEWILFRNGFFVYGQLFL